MNSRDALCETCEIRRLAPERAEICASLAAECVRQWWFGNPTLELYAVTGDVLFHSGYQAQLTNDERKAIYNCMSEHASGREETLNP